MSAHNEPETRQLPPEILELIISKIDSQASLLPLALTSTSLRFLSQRALFSAPKLTTPPTHFQFLSAIISSPTYLAPFVRVYTQFGVGQSIDDREALPRLTASALRLMINLKKLGYSISAGEQKPSTGILAGCTFRLQALSWVCQADDARGLLREVLPHQDGLTHLGILCAKELQEEDIESAKGLCPKLISFAGSPSLFPAFVGGRKGGIKHLQWSQDMVNTPLDVKLPVELQDVESLVYHAYWHFPLHSVLGRFRSLSFLLVIAGKAQVELFPDLPNLRVIVVYCDPGLITADARQTDISAAFRHCTALEYVDWEETHMCIGAYTRYTVVDLDASRFSALRITEDMALSAKTKECLGMF